jgi:hypothetical protein
MFETANLFGICHLSVVPVRTEPSDKAEIGTQLLFGDAFIILKFSEDNKWVHIAIEFDSYQGWIDSKQYKSVSKTYFEEYTGTNHSFSKELLSYISSDKRSIPVLHGSVIPFISNGVVDLEGSMQFKGELIAPFKTNDFKAIEKSARFYLGAPYLWGGKCHFGIDCSGFVQQVYKMNGIKLPRDAWQQGECGSLTDFADSLPGDLVFFNNPQGRIVHVGILMEQGKIIHASGEVRIDNIDPTGIFNEARNLYTHKFHSVKRLLQP